MLLITWELYKSEIRHIHLLYYAMAGIVVATKWYEKNFVPETIIIRCEEIGIFDNKKIFMN